MTLFHWIAALFMTTVIGVELLPGPPQPLIANLIWFAIIFTVLEERPQ